MIYKKPIYLDYNATTPVDPEVLDSILPYLKENFGNPSSSHFYGIEGKKAVLNARESIARFVNCEVDEVVFTSSGSESNNYAIKGIAFSKRDKGKHIITSKIEHPSVLKVFSFLESQGFRISYISVDKYGVVDLDELKSVLTPSTILISIMHSNNEVGTLEPIREISKIASQHGVTFHTDAAQSVGKVDVYFKDLGADLLSLAGHKLYAPKGVGALIVKRGVTLVNLVHGADHEQGRRAGTENVPFIVGLGKACEIALRNMKTNGEKMLKRRNELHQGLLSVIRDIQLNGHLKKRLPNTLSLSFPDVNANTLLSELVDIAASSGAACHSGIDEVSHVLKAMGLGKERGTSTIRFSVGKWTTEEEIRQAVEFIGDAVMRLRKRNAREMGVNIDRNGIKLTRYTQGLGCSCKIRPKILEDILKSLATPTDEKILVGVDTKDDAAVYELNDDQAVVQTVDFFTPMVDDPENFGKIAVSNSLSDIYAMGAKPLFALNIVCFPSKRLPLSVLEKILKGGEKKASEAGISIIGGHTIDDNEPKYGLAVTGIVNPKRIFRNSNAKPGDVLVLTKPIGTGVITTAIKKGMADPKIEKRVIEVMTSLNKEASEIMVESKANACTDITGFGLLGHLLEMAKGSKVDVTIFLSEVPFIEGALQLAKMGVYPGGTVANLEFVERDVVWESVIDEASKILLADAQTSGGLLISIPKSHQDDFLNNLRKKGGRDSKVIGIVNSSGKGKIHVKIKGTF